ncbi:MAG: Phosphotransferase system, phosphocarrier protein HPr [Chlorobi bacterium]|nr:Phosphotransferase system, phosphocarrier protein HPr [Chlorobiota bacterium]
MIVTTVRIRNRAGLHTRPAATIVKKASKYKSDFAIVKDGFRINGKSIIGVMTLAAEQGSELTLEFNGTDEADAAADIGEYFERGFDEEF